MLGVLQGAAGFIFIFGVVVFVHELGHFLAAKATGVYAPRFSIGFGPGPRKRWGETEYILGLIPLGGYVRMASRDDEATAFLEGGSEEEAARKLETGEAARPKDWDPNALIPFGPKPVPAHRWFESKPLYQRLIILFAGVSMNALLTFVILVGMAKHYGRSTEETRVVARVAAFDTTEPLQEALRHGDTITAVQGVPVANFNEIRDAFLGAPGDSLRITTHRGDVVVPAGYPHGPRRQAYVIAIESFKPPVLDSISPDQPAARGGLQRGDSIVSIDGNAIQSFDDVIRLISASPGKQVQIEIVRGAVPMHITVEPAPVVIRDSAGKPQTVGRIGAGPRTVFRHEELPFRAAIAEGATRTGQMAGSIFAVLRGLFNRDVSMNQLGGPIEIAKQSARAAQQGIDQVLGLLALLSINLAVLNLLPIPVLDGGQIVLQVAESVKGRPFSARTRQYILGTGVALVLLLMLVVTYNDILRWFS
jgi:regulator of sigma E protease